MGCMPKLLCSVLFCSALFVSSIGHKLHACTCTKWSDNYASKQAQCRDDNKNTVPIVWSVTITSY
eukprot:jgi/Psemu1/301319/fgenesh1_kg.30_\